MTPKQVVPDVTYDRIKKIDEYAKSMGLTIYRICYGFEHNEKHYTCDITCLNFPPERLEKEPNLEGLAEVL